MIVYTMFFIIYSINKLLYQAERPIKISSSLSDPECAAHRLPLNDEKLYFMLSYQFEVGIMLGQMLLGECIQTN